MKSCSESKPYMISNTIEASLDYDCVELIMRNWRGKRENSKLDQFLGARTMKYIVQCNTFRLQSERKGFLIAQQKPPSFWILRDFFAVFEHFCLACPGKRVIGEARSLGTQDPMTKKIWGFSFISRCNLPPGYGSHELRFVRDRAGECLTRSSDIKEWDLTPENREKCFFWGGYN